MGDEKIREHLNPVSQYGNDPDSAVDTNKYNDHFDEEPCEDEEEMMEDEDDEEWTGPDVRNHVIQIYKFNSSTLRIWIHIMKI